MIWIIILNWNGKQDTQACLYSLKHVKGEFKVLVVDNGSTDGSVQYLRSAFPEVLLLETGQNLGFSGGNNHGITYALDRGAEAIFLLNNDTIVHPDILITFQEACIKNPQAHIFGAKNYLFDAPDHFDHFGGMWNQKTAAFDLVGLREKDDGISWEEGRVIDYVCGCSLFVKREVFLTIGLLEPAFFLYWEEADLCFRARKAGFLSMTCPQAKIWHKVSASLTSKPLATYFWWRNRLLWMERHRPRRERFFLIPSILRLLKLWCLKSLQNFFSPTPKRRTQYLHYHYALKGVKDYLLRRFGNISHE